MCSVYGDGVGFCYYKKKGCIIEGGAEGSLKLMPVTLVPTEILNTSPCVLSRAGMTMPFLARFQT